MAFGFSLVEKFLQFLQLTGSEKFPEVSPLLTNLNGSMQCAYFSRVVCLISIIARAIQLNF